MSTAISRNLALPTAIVRYPRRAFIVDCVSGVARRHLELHDHGEAPCPEDEGDRPERLACVHERGGAREAVRDHEELDEERPVQGTVVRFRSDRRGV